MHFPISKKAYDGEKDFLGGLSGPSMGPLVWRLAEKGANCIAIERTREILVRREKFLALLRVHSEVIKKWFEEVDLLKINNLAEAFFYLSKIQSAMAILEGFQRRKKILLEYLGGLNGLVDGADSYADGKNKDRREEIGFAEEIKRKRIDLKIKMEEEEKILVGGAREEKDSLFDCMVNRIIELARGKKVDFLKKIENEALFHLPLYCQGVVEEFFKIVKNRMVFDKKMEDRKISNEEEKGGIDPSYALFHGKMQFILERLNAFSLNEKNEQGWAPEAKNDILVALNLLECFLASYRSECWPLVRVVEIAILKLDKLGCLTEEENESLKGRFAEIKVGRGRASREEAFAILDKTPEVVKR